MNKQKLTKIMAILALFGIIISVIGTGVLFIVEKNAREREVQEQIKEFIKNNSGKIEIATGKIEINSGEVSTGNTTN